MLRDKLTLGLGIGFPVLLFLLLTLLQSNLPVELFTAERLTPGIATFGFSFISLFSALIVAKDRDSSLMLRLQTSPLRDWEYMVGYTAPLLPMAFAQCVILFGVACLFGLHADAKVLLAMVVLIPAAILYIAIGLLCGTLLNDKQIGGLCGALLTNVSAWLSGTWFDLDLVGGVLKKIAECLPFCHSVNAGRYALQGAYAKIVPELIWVIGYAAVLLIAAVVVWAVKMRGRRNG
jgi:ABC-2 type transport system permease protein